MKTTDTTDRPTELHSLSCLHRPLLDCSQNDLGGATLSPSTPSLTPKLARGYPLYSPTQLQVQRYTDTDRATALRYTDYMARLQSVCPECGAVFSREDSSAYCSDCKPQRDYATRTKTTRERGYNERWNRLSRKARELQPFCSDCGTMDDLTADHTELAWQRFDAGKSIRLQDIDVVCRSCNSARGEARGDDIGERRKIVDAERLSRLEFLSDE